MPGLGASGEEGQDTTELRRWVLRGVCGGEGVGRGMGVHVLW